MSAKIIDGKAIAARVRADVAREVEAFTRETGSTPGLATVLVGEDPASAVYVGGKQRACAEVGMTPFDRRLPANATFEEVAEELERLNGDPAVSGVLLQLPVPAHLDGPALTAIISAEKDVDGLTPVNAGLLSLGRPGLRPCTPAGVLELLAAAPAGASAGEERDGGRDAHAHSEGGGGVRLEGAEAVVVGRSNLFGKPMAQMLLERNATVTVCHSRTRDLREVCARADVLIVAVGRARMVTGDFVKPGAVVIDVGMNRLTPEQAGNKSGLVGDVDFAQAAERASAITPVPGGVGPMTIALLLRNTLYAARYQAHVGALLAEVDASSLEGEGLA
ncbi:MAG TPA: bifunctional 5,10-methylenetetrahydrofolate dehydrogenase/5,10-methenyltetrahydrofolate cyclohydrolase [Solirubrobacteraceae bacterium]|nr:bifunctional 5,10-methylenetetrahydrofolate dehydrogenase/5,10-methenyltetrahydrofolate cyclohydrolase [Solirubrobacteraceae bacterium]